MKLISFFFALWVAITTCYADPPGHDWRPPGPGDVRSPCPLLNTLANHNYLPHDGKNIDFNITKKALTDSINADEGLIQFLFNNAITTNPEPNATTYSLAGLSQHNILEHDASLSRLDAHWGPPDIFNPIIFAETQTYWSGPVINVTMAAAARAGRMRTANATNPNYSLSTAAAGFSLGENAAYILSLGERHNYTVRKRLVEYLFEHERLPIELGWKRPEPPVSYDELQYLVRRIYNETDPDYRGIVIPGMHG